MKNDNNYLRGNTICLFPVKEQDIDQIVKWRNKSFVQERFIYREPFTLESQKIWMRTMVGTGKVEQYIIHVIMDDKAIGTVYLRDIDYTNKKAEFGIFIGEEEYLGKGYGREAACLILQHAFMENGLHKVRLRVFADNVRAVKSYMKAGFIREGYFKDEVRIDGKYQDLIFMAAFNPKI